MTVTIRMGDCREVLRTLPDESVHCCVTSPPYWGLRDYGVEGQIGLETTFDAFIAEMIGVFSEVRRVLRDDGTLWLNLGDSYAGSWGAQSRAEAPGPNSNLSGGQIYAAPKSTHAGSIKRTPGIKPKDLIGIPWRVAFALQTDGWYLRQDIIWSKPNPMPESVTDRCTKAHEYIFLLSKRPRYYYDAQAIQERGYGSNEVRNKRSVWEVATAPFSEGHFATFPPALIEPCIKAGCPIGGTVIDPFGGAGTTGLVADRLQRNALLIELNPDYATMAERRIHNDAPLFAEVSQ